MTSDPLKIFLAVINKKKIDKKWTAQPHEAFKHLANSSKGDAGEEFIKRYAKALGFNVKKLNRLGDWDIEINGKKFEVKLASEDVAGSFQFNHIRYDSRYDFLLCLGVSPKNLFFGIWSKGEIATGVAGNMVSMGKNQNASFKLTKKVNELEDIQKLKERLTAILSS